MSIYQSQEVHFKPTYLYIKQHSVTGKLYFGKTTRKDPLRYAGSGEYWNDHLKVHNKEHVETLWYCLFHDVESIKEFAVGCSEQWDIVKMKDAFGNKIWANLKPENGLDGGWTDKAIKAANASPNAIHKNLDHQKKWRQAGQSSCWEHSNHISKNPEHVKIMQIASRNSLNANWKKLVICEHCGKEGTTFNLARWHFDN